MILPVLFAFSASLAAQDGEGVIALIHANIIDGVSPEVLPEVTLIMEGRTIKSMERGGVPPAGAKVYDLKGKYVMPGLIDAHVHIRDFDAARRALMSGVTTVRCLGVPHFTDVGMRELAAAGRIESPEILAAGYHVRPDPDPGFFMDFPGMSDLMKAKVKGPEHLYRMGRAMVDRGVDWLKVNATARAGLPQTDPREPYYSQEEMEALVKAGAAAGIPVAAHAHGDEGGRAAVLAGVRSIEHGTYLSDETLAMMAERGTYLVPTIAVVTDLALPGGDYHQPLLEIRGRHMLPRVREMAAHAHRLGVKIVAATDTGYDAESTLRLSQELEELVGVGLSNLEAIRAATSQAAALLGVDDHTGRIAPGFDADLLILERNPLEKIGAIHDPLMIFYDGKLALNRLEW